MHRSVHVQGDVLKAPTVAARAFKAEGTPVRGLAGESSLWAQAAKEPWLGLTQAAW